DADPSRNIFVSRASSPGGSSNVYAGKAAFLVHSDYPSTSLDAYNDFALIVLKDRAIDLSLTGRANIYIAQFQPIWTSPQMFTFAGWGTSTTAGEIWCDENTPPVFRTGPGRLATAARDANEVRALWGATHICPGDSGSPWLFVPPMTRTGREPDRGK